MSQIGLTEAIERLREELGAAQDAGANQQLRFEVVEVEMELLVELRKEGGGKVDFKVVGADGKISSSTSHKLKLRLNVKDAARGNASLEVGDRSERPWED
ncbi:trypco2 family protein [Actinomadura scrupuli]|uniref:trypco2 family protein n=1 Tax=Actinomadura scrupuli TaxID=559629 RepID=UPI003D9923F9